MKNMTYLKQLAKVDKMIQQYDALEQRIENAEYKDEDERDQWVEERYELAFKLFAMTERLGVFGK